MFMTLNIIKNIYGTWMKMDEVAGLVGTFTEKIGCTM